MTYGSILDEVISGLQAENVPSEYIVMAKIVNLNGIEKILRGVELEKFLNDPHRGLDVSEARVILDIRKIRTTITKVLYNFFDELNLSVNDIILSDLHNDMRNLHRRDDEFPDDEDWTPPD